MEKKKEDRRTSYSKKMIRESLYELMKEKPLNKISVKEICEKADVNRSTFYAYYLDIYDLHQKIIKEFFEKQRGIINHTKELLEKKESLRTLTVADYYEITFYYLSTVKSNKELYKFIFNQNSTNSIHISFGKVFYHTINDLMASEVPLNHADTFKKSFTFISGGTTGIIMDWLKKDCVESTEILASHLAAFYFGVFNRKK